MINIELANTTPKGNEKEELTDKTSKGDEEEEESVGTTPKCDKEVKKQK